jgi:hypothetical protein
VLGTDFGADSSVPGMTKFICLSGTVLIVPKDTTLSPMTCQAGNTVMVKTGAHPATQPATRSNWSDGNTSLSWTSNARFRSSLRSF